MVFWVSLLSTLLLLGVGLWQYVTIGSQWLWIFIEIPSTMPTLVTIALSSELGTDRKRTLGRIGVTEGWVALPVLSAITLAAAAIMIPNKQAPDLHDIQFFVHHLLGLLPTVGRKIRRVLFPTQQRPSESREGLFPSERTDAQELQILPRQTRSDFDTDRDVGQEREA